MNTLDPSIPGVRTYLDSIAHVDMLRNPDTKKLILDFTDYSGDNCRITISFQTMEDIIKLYQMLKEDDAGKGRVFPGQMSIEQESPIPFLGGSWGTPEVDSW